MLTDGCTITEPHLKPLLSRLNPVGACWISCYHKDAALAPPRCHRGSAYSTGVKQTTNKRVFTCNTFAAVSTFQHVISATRSEALFWGPHNHNVAPSAFSHLHFGTPIRTSHIIRFLKKGGLKETWDEVMRAGSAERLGEGVWLCRYVLAVMRCW